MVLEHPLGDQHLVEVLVVGPDPLVGGLRAPGAAPPLVVVSHDVDDATRRIQGLVDAENNVTTMSSLQRGDK